MMAYKTRSEIPTLESEVVESDLIFSGLVGMIDPERPEAAEAVRVAKEAGIRPIMITGDHQRYGRSHCQASRYHRSK